MIDFAMSNIAAILINVAIPIIDLDHLIDFIHLSLGIGLTISIIISNALARVAIIVIGT